MHPKSDSKEIPISLHLEVEYTIVPVTNGYHCDIHDIFIRDPENFSRTQSVLEFLTEGELDQLANEIIAEDIAHN